ncbi:hypothetical protein OHA72_22095 [Dactylosporangium sp. NBC_01737]|uniref:hypothetical protein n=1 Tax=Dactylosporangium sp. NBC_01737 TaxID=2975959 RepID=UPI002E15BC90|nr:hypothetical protein OHA72_22095 [Dactylosporangium sp. NBC_01737]
MTSTMTSTPFAAAATSTTALELPAHDNGPAGSAYRNFLAALVVPARQEAAQT